jgi:hypothetical protein
MASGSADGNGSLSEKELHPNDYAGMLASRLKSTFNMTYIDGRLELVYPIEYGGAYIDSSNNLHIVLSKYATNATIDSYRNIMGDPDVIFVAAEFPLSCLYEAQDAIGPAMGTFRIDVAGANEITNRLELNLEDSTKQSDIIEYLNSRITNFDARCITFLGPNPVTLTGGEITPSTASNDGFFAADIPTTYVVVPVVLIVVTAALACCLVFVRRGIKP